MNNHCLKFFRVLIGVIGLSLITLTGSAERVSVETARQVAMNAVKNFTPDTKSVRSLDLVYTALPLGAVTKNVGEADFYVFNLSDRGGFVIISGEDRVHPVLGYSKTNRFQSEGMPENVRGWLEGYQKEIAYVVQHDVQPSISIQKEWTDYLNGLNQPCAGGVQLETAQWGQGKPFNLECQVVPGKEVPCGCVATALAILMKYHEWPNQAKGGVSSYQGKSVSYSSYDWNNMPMTYTSSYTAAEGQAVADLIWNIGANVEMDYKPKGSGASPVNAATAFHEVFDYSKKTVYKNREYFSSNEWSDMIQRELDAGRPLYYDGSKESGGGHAFVCDGYQGEMFAFNWGWNGYNNGLFLLSSMDAAGNGDGYVNYQGCILVQEPESGDDYLAELRYTKDIQSEEVKVGTPFTTSFCFYNSGNITLNVQLSLGIVDVSDYSVKDLVMNVNGQNKYDWTAIQEGYGFFDNPLEIPVVLPNDLGTNEYMMLVYKLEEGGEWTPLRSEKFKDRIGMNGPVHEGEEITPPVETSYKVSADLEHLTIAGLPRKVKEGGTITACLKAKDGYALPETISVKMGSKRLPGSAYSYNSSTGELAIPDVTGDVGIMAVGIQIEEDEYSIKAVLEHLTITGLPAKVGKGERVEGLFKPETGYELPYSISVQMGDEELSETYYNYNYMTGELTIPDVQGDILIQASGVEKKVATYKVSVELKNLTIDGLPEEVKEGETIKAVLSADEAYKLPENIIIRMGKKDLSESEYEYDSLTGDLLIPNVMGDVLIKAIGIKKVQNEFTVKTVLKHLTITGLPDKVNKGERVEGLFKPEIGYEFPYSISVKMGDEELSVALYNYNFMTGELMIPDVQGDVRIIATGMESTVGNETITQDGADFRVQDNRIQISTVRSVEVFIYDLMGRCIYRDRVEGTAEVQLPDGSYILVLGDKQYKVMIR